MTTAKTLLQLTTYDVDNLNHLAQAERMSKAEAFHHAMAFCDKAVDYMRRGYTVSALYADSYARYTTSSFSPSAVAHKINTRRKDVEVSETALPLFRTTADRLENIKNFLKVDSDTLAVAFALEYARTAHDRTQACNNGKKATIFFSLTNSPGDRGYLLAKEHPYNANLGNKFRRASRRLKQQLADANPFRKKAVPAALPAPAAAEPAQTQTIIAKPQPQPQEIHLLQSPTINKRVQDGAAQPPKNGGGFSL
ncbi:MAG: hypothetical protein H3C49_11760 [Alphaproteobacteria bacterium]|nr:hypothetical protein [Alphaproteobacteria bacterium]